MLRCKVVSLLFVAFFFRISTTHSQTIPTTSSSTTTTTASNNTISSNTTNCETINLIQSSTSIHNGKDISKEGSLIAADISVLLNNEKISEFELNTETIILLDSDTDYTLIIKGIDDIIVQFTDVLIRLEATNGQDISTSLYPSRGSSEYFNTLLKPLSCEKSNVEALRWYNSDVEKTSEVSFDLVFEQHGGYKLDISVGQSLRSSSESSSDLYHSSFEVMVESPKVSSPRTSISSPSNVPSATPISMSTDDSVFNNYPTISPSEIFLESEAPTSLETDNKSPNNSTWPSDANQITSGQMKCSQISFLLTFMPLFMSIYICSF